MEEFWKKLVSRCPKSNQRFTPIMTQQKALQTRILKMENCDKCKHSPLYIHGRGEICDSSRGPTASGKPEAEVIQKRGSIKCTTYSSWSLKKRKLDVNQVHLKTRGPQGDMMQYFHQGAMNWDSSSRLPFWNLLIHRNWEDPFWGK